MKEPVEEETPLPEEAPPAEVKEEAPSKYGHEFYNFQSGKNFQTEPAK